MFSKSFFFFTFYRFSRCFWGAQLPVAVTFPRPVEDWRVFAATPNLPTEIIPSKIR